MDVEGSQENSVPVLAVTAAVGAVVLLLVMLCSLGRKQEDDHKEKEEETQKEAKENHKLHNSAGGKKKDRAQLRKKDSRTSFTHPWLAGSLKNHSTPVLDLDFSPNGKHMASTSEDRTVLIWNVKDFTKKEHKCVRANIEYDHATRIKFSPDSKAFLVSLYTENTVRVIKMGKKDDGSLGNFQTGNDFPKQHEAEIINIGIASNGKWIMTCSKDTVIKIWDLKGEILSIIDTHQMNNSYGAVSPCGRFVASSGFTPDVKVWEVCFDKGGNFREVIRAFELKGHSAGVHHFSFSNNSSRMATVSKDGTWKLWDTDVEYRLQQDPKLLQTGVFNHPGPSLIALSPNATTVAIAADQNISIFNALNAECEQTIENAHSVKISCLGFDLSSNLLVSAGDKNIHVFHNMTGYRALITDLKQQQLKATSQAHKQRLQQQIDEARKNLKAVEDSMSG